jgi:hypothetical protein
MKKLLKGFSPNEYLFQVMPIATIPIFLYDSHIEWSDHYAKNGS